MHCLRMIEDDAAKALQLGRVEDSGIESEVVILRIGHVLTKLQDRVDDL
jgi:hypothetical protein